MAVGFNMSAITFTSTFADDKDCRRMKTITVTKIRRFRNQMLRQSVKLTQRLEIIVRTISLDPSTWSVIVTARALLTAIYNHHHQTTGILVTIHLKLLLSQITVVVFLP